MNIITHVCIGPSLYWGLWHLFSSRKNKSPTRIVGRFFPYVVRKTNKFRLSRAIFSVNDLWKQLVKDYKYSSVHFHLASMWLLCRHHKYLVWNSWRLHKIFHYKWMGLRRRRKVQYKIEGWLIPIQVHRCNLESLIRILESNQLETTCYRLWCNSIHFYFHNGWVMQTSWIPSLQV